jgi:hypothetical protein
MFTKTYVAAVGTPVRVDIGLDRCIAWYARKINDIASSRKTGGFVDSAATKSSVPLRPQPLRGRSRRKDGPSLRYRYNSPTESTS